MVENMVRGVIETAKLEINFLYKYRELMVRYKYEIREQLLKMYSQDLLRENLH